MLGLGAVDQAHIVLRFGGVHSGSFLLAGKMSRKRGTEATQTHRVALPIVHQARHAPAGAGASQIATT
ncbi:hypothetical protein MAFF211271_02350 [Ralstonia syzygii subsp. indonesiensis]|nr:hypothetical protein MAFF211271_02350 [Ralstonia pseudosolanacearum]